MKAGHVDHGSSRVKAQGNVTTHQGYVKTEKGHGNSSGRLWIQIQAMQMASTLQG
jgi:hypothetical protein